MPRRLKKKSNRGRKTSPRVRCASCGEHVRATVVRSGRLSCMDCMKLSPHMFDSACDALSLIEKELAEPNPMK